MGAADADKSDMIFECIRQLSDIKTYFKLLETQIKVLFPKYKQNSETLSNVISIKETAQKKMQTFCCPKCSYMTYHIYIEFGKFLKSNCRETFCRKELHSKFENSLTDSKTKFLIGFVFYFQ